MIKNILVIYIDNFNHSNLEFYYFKFESNNSCKNMNGDVTSLLVALKFFNQMYDTNIFDGWQYGKITLFFGNREKTLS